MGFRKGIKKSCKRSILFGDGPDEESVSSEMNEAHCLLDLIWLWPDAKNQAPTAKLYNGRNKCYVRMDSIRSYTAFYDDFGAMNLASVYRFSSIIESLTDCIDSDSDIVFVSKSPRHSLRKFCIMILEK